MAASLIHSTARSVANEIETFARVNCSMIVSSRAAAAAAAGASKLAISDATYLFTCKTCNRKFSSFQALGGHRASHKKIRPAISGDSDSPVSVRTTKTHACTICGQEFLIGQALGGHMRRHRQVPTAGGSSVTTERSTENSDGSNCDRKKRKNDVDLVPVPEMCSSVPHGKRVCLDLGLNTFTIDKEERYESEIDEGETVEDDHIDFLKLELRLPINSHW